MITFMITYEVRMNCQVTLIALIFFQNCSKYNTILHNKDVLIFAFSVIVEYLLTYEGYRYEAIKILEMKVYLIGA